MKLYLCCTGLSSGIIYSLCYWEKPRFLECNVLYLMMCGMFSLQGGLETVHMFQSLMCFLLFHSKTKNDFTLKNSWEWKDNQCLYWMKLPKSWFSCPQPCSHNGFGNTRITDWCYCDIIYPSHSLVLQAEAAFEAGDYSRAASFDAKVVSQHIQVFGLVRIAIDSCVLYAQRIAGFWCWIFCTMYPCFSDNTKWRHLRRLHWSLF